jgi:tetratricopeptide (TPR) repeat protein
MAAFFLMSTGCGSTRVAPSRHPTELRYEQVSHSARSAFDGGGYSAAASLYRQALDLAYIRDDVKAIVDTQYNLALSLLKNEEYREAASYLEAAAAAMDRDHQGLPEDFILLDGTLNYRQGYLETARTRIDSLLAVPDGPAPMVRSRALYLKGRIASDMGKTEVLRQVIEDLEPPAEPFSVSDTLELRGRLALAEDRFDEAVALLDRAADLQRQESEYDAMAETLAAGAAACESAGRPLEAALHYLRAARSRQLRGLHGQVKEWLNRAAALADSAGAEDVGREARHRLEVLRQQEQPISSNGVRPSNRRSEESIM